MLWSIHTNFQIYCRDMFLLQWYFLNPEFVHFLNINYNLSVISRRKAEEKKGHIIPTKESPLEFQRFFSYHLQDMTTRKKE